jgi:manganese/zinc/iron transport system permease protein
MRRFRIEPAAARGPAIAAGRRSPARLAKLGAAVAVLALAVPASGGAPSAGEIADVILLRDTYNTRLVVLSTTALGVAAGLVGTFLLLRKRALMGDALSHATLPGIAVAFMAMVAFGGSGKFLPGLLLGAAASGLLGVACVLLITHQTRLKDDAALGIVLSVLFGLGVVLLGFVQDMPEGSAAGLQSFIYGKTASVVQRDLWLILGAAVLVLAACVVLYKEFGLLCFDEAYAGAQGWPVVLLDLLLMVLVTVVTVIGLQAVGLILVIALLVTPAAAARFWTERLGHMLLAAALIGGASGWLGSALSALVPRLPAGAVIVLVAATVFAVSMAVGPARGLLPRLARHVDLARRVGRQHLLRAFYERLELTATADGDRTGLTVDELLAMRSWSPAGLRRQLRRAVREEIVAPVSGGRFRLTAEGARRAARVARNHRLWELYLITHADVAPSHVDRDADQIEHVLDPALVARLEAQLGLATHVPPSPHAIGDEPSGGGEPR